MINVNAIRDNILNQVQVAVVDSAITVGNNILIALFANSSHSASDYDSCTATDDSSKCLICDPNSFR